MASPDLADADPVAVLLAWYQNSQAVADLLGGTGHVSGILEAPWPHVVLSDGHGGSMRDMVWEGEFEVTLETYGSPDGAPGMAALRKIAVRMAKIAAELPEGQVTDPTTPVVSRVKASGVAAYTPLSTGQPRYTTGVLLTIRPPLSLA